MDESVASVATPPVTFSPIVQTPAVKEEVKDEDVQQVDNGASEQVYEIQLTDDLADSLVNPPTDPEVSEEEETVARDTLTPVDNVKTDPKAVTHKKDDVIEDKQVSDATEKPDKKLETMQPKEEKQKTDTVDIKVKHSDELVIKGAKSERKAKNKKSKKVTKLVLNTPAEEKPETTSNDATPKETATASSNGKMSYSSVIKSRLGASTEPATPPPTPAVEATVSTPVASKPAKQPVAVAETATKQKDKTKNVIENNDSWEQIPESVTRQEQSWEKTSKKGKKRNKVKIEEKREVSNKIEEELVAEEVKEEIKQEISAETVKNEEIVGIVETTEVADVDSASKSDDVDTEAESEKRRVKKKKKKHESGEADEANNTHRIIICDDQVKQIKNIFLSVL